MRGNLKEMEGLFGLTVGEGGVHPGGRGMASIAGSRGNKQ